MNYIMSDTDRNLLIQITGRLIEDVPNIERASVNQASAEPHAPTSVGTGFKWGPKSLRELQGVRRELVETATLALMKYSRIDFTCFDGLRTKEEQRLHVRNGVSKTMNSKHLVGDAVDLVPIIGGIPKWDWNGCYEVACAMDLAATELGYANHIVWGGSWDKTLAQYGGDVSAYSNEVQAYRSRNPGRDFIDGPHFEWKA